MLMKNIEEKEWILAVAKEAIKQYKEDVEQEERKTLFRNTKALLNHYHELKEHCQDTLNEEKNISEEMDFIRQLREDIVLESIKRTRSRTILMMSHIDGCLHVLHKKMNEKGQGEKYEVINILYLNEETYALPSLEKIEIAAEQLHVSDRTIKRYETEMINELSVLLFGIGALKLVK
jgi:hypothetical protein